ncbi:MAG: cupin domain-containing protein [Pseudomonadota bacterium]
MKKNILAGLTPSGFLRLHWQKRPLFAPGALAQYADAVTRADLFTLAQCEDVESRIVQRLTRGRWQLRHGPFTRRDLKHLPRTGWTLLVQGVEQKLWRAAQLLSEFSFIPHARLDDIMVSYAAPGGGVGAHFDSYDVFLLQGCGRRRWQISLHDDLELVPDIPVKILQRFTPTDEWLVNPGDLLYLPPQCAHNGVAVDECITYSIGFRAPTAQELSQRFLEFLDDRLQLEGIYTDPNLKPTCTPARIPHEMIKHAAGTLDSLRWKRKDVEEFMGVYLTEPKANVVFKPPLRAMKQEAFTRRAQRVGIRLALPTRMLASGKQMFVNGDAHTMERRPDLALTQLANQRQLAPPLCFGKAAAEMLYEWYCVGYLELGVAPRKDETKVCRGRGSVEPAARNE